MYLFHSPKQKGSELLSKDDNDQIFDLVGPNCQILSATVMELHRSADSTGEGEWAKEEVGVLCLVQDLNEKCYFFRIFCLIRKRIVWEYEINGRMQYSTPKPFLHSFQAENCMYAFYFVSEQEASLLAVRMNEISTDVLGNARSLEGLGIHEINPIVEAPRKFTSFLNFNKNKNARWFSFGSNRKPSSNIFKMCLRSNEETKKKKVTSEEIADPKHFEHISQVSEFKIQRGNRKNESLLKIPFSPSMLNISSTLSDSILPVVNDSLNRPKPASASTSPLPSKKSARFCTFVHAGENTKRNGSDRDIASPFPQDQLQLPPCLSVFGSPSESVGHFDTIGRSTPSLRDKNMMVSSCTALDSKSVSDEVSRHDFDASYLSPLLSKTSHGLTHRSVSSDLRGSAQDNDSISRNSSEVKESKLNYRKLFVDPFLIGVPIPKGPSPPREIAAVEITHCSNPYYVAIGGTTSTEYDSITVFPHPPPCFLPKIVAEKRKTVVDDRDSDPGGDHYDMVGEPRPVSPPVSKSISYTRLEPDSPSWNNRKKLSVFSNSSGNTTARSNTCKTRVLEAARERYDVTPVMTKHPFLLPPSFSSSENGLSNSAPSQRDVRDSSTSTRSNSTLSQNHSVRNSILNEPSNSVSLQHDAFRAALNEAIKKGVELKRVDRSRRN